MSLKWCDKHKKYLIQGYNGCPSCETEKYKKDIERLKEALNDFVEIEYSSQLCQEGVIDKCYCRKCIRLRAIKLLK